MRNYKVILLLLMILALTISGFQSGMKIFKEQDLKGYYQKNEPPKLKFFTWKRWFSGGFQDTISKRINDYIGLRNSLIRVNNQFDYTFFGIIHAEGFIQGKQRYLYEEDYIREYTGEYFIGKKAIDKKLSRLKNVIDSLSYYHIPLILVFEPGKASFYPENIPQRFNPEKRTQGNYDYMIRRSQELGLNFLDLNKYFIKIKHTARYPLFPRYGMHWSQYGVTFALDTLVKSIENATRTRLPKFTIFPLILSSTPLGTDNDIGKLLNLVCPLMSTPGAYPTITFNSASGSLPALVIADSYYLNIVDDYGRKLFKSQEYWYYNKKMYPNHNNTPPEYVDKSNLREKLKNHGLILLMVSEINLHSGFWNFADEAFLAFHPEIKDPLIYGIENEIRNDREWFRFMVKKARHLSKSLEEVITEDASYTFYTNYNRLAGKGYWDSIYHLTLDIKNNADWLAKVEKKALDRKISVDSMVLLDAIYSYDQLKKNH